MLIRLKYHKLCKIRLYLLLQAYTVELEAELNQLREENTHLKQALVINIWSINWLRGCHLFRCHRYLLTILAFVSLQLKQVELERKRKQQVIIQGFCFLLMHN